jgi:uncharacterized protein
LSVKKAIELIKELGGSDDLVSHMVTVYGLATYLGSRLHSRGISIDLDLLGEGAILHDIGRTKTHLVTHGYVGAQLLREKGFQEEAALIVERHVGGGIGEEEAPLLGLPKKSYIPKSLEEKIVCYADKLASIDNVKSFPKVLQEYRRALGPKHPAIDRLKALHREMKALLPNLQLT